jgi:Tripartite tricarboxylate transporter family receptor
MRNRKREICTSGSVRDEDGQPPHLLGRRQFLHLAAGAAALSGVARFAWAQAYPSRPVRLIVGFPPGGGADTTARIIGPWLSQRLSQPVVIENRPGASSTLAAQAVVNSPPDGYTLLLLGGSALMATLITSVPFDLQRDLAPVSGLTDYPMVLVAHPSVLRAGQGKAGHDQHGLVRHRLGVAPGGRAVQDDGRHQSAACALSQLVELCGSSLYLAAKLVFS